MTEGTKDIPSALPRLVIEVLASGAVNVAGPINDKILSYGLLEMGKEAIHDHHERQRNRGPSIETAGAGTLLKMADRMKEQRENGKP